MKLLENFKNYPTSTKALLITAGVLVVLALIGVVVVLCTGGFNGIK